jgi:DNA-directed RNA polymerase specialized sigma24 family protein
MTSPEILDLDNQLSHLALTAQRHPPLSQERQVALRQLVTGILRSRRLCRPQLGQFAGNYQDIYDEALQELLLFICQNIDRYDPDRGTVMAWVNMLFDRRFFREAIPKVLGKQNLTRMTLMDLDRISAPAAEPTLTDTIQEFVERDPDNHLKQEHIKNHPTANFQVLLQRRLQGISWQDIANEFGIAIPTLSSFYYRRLDKFSTQFKDYCVD